MSFRSHELYAYTLVLCRQDLQSVLAAMIQRSFKSIGTSISKEIKKRQGDNDAEIAKTLQTMHKMIVNKNFCQMDNDTISEKSVPIAAVVDKVEKYKTKVSSAPSPDVQAAVNEVLKRDFLGGMISLISVGIDQMLGNASARETKKVDFHTVFANKILLRIDYSYTGTMDQNSDEIVHRVSAEGNVKTRF